MYRKTIYSEKFGFGTFEHMIKDELGEGRLNELMSGLIKPDIETESGCGCVNMARLMDRLDAEVDAPALKATLMRVRHGLNPDQSAWAHEELVKMGNLDAFIAKNRQDGIDNFNHLYATGEDFYGQNVTKEVLDFVLAHPACLSAQREGNVLRFMAFPYNMEEYIKATDDKMKRYYACHCPFARESILAEKTVSKTLCNCSLGHVLNFWEAALDCELEGRVVSSVLGGDLLCHYEAYLPDDVMRDYLNA